MKREDKVARNAEIMALYGRGVPAVEIGLKVGLSTSGVYSVLARGGVVSMGPRGRAKDQAAHEEVLAIYLGGATMQEIADARGLTRQRIQQMLASLGQAGRDVQHQRMLAARAERDLQRLLQRCREAKPCDVCGAWVLRRSARTCSKTCADLWRTARHRMNDTQYQLHRMALARSVLRHAPHHKWSEIQWARKMLSKNPPAPNRRYEIKGSKASEAAALARQMREDS